jgi:integrase
MYLFKHPRTGVYWIRITVPPAARAAVGQRELTRTLRTKVLEEAKRLALPVVAEFLKRIDVATGRGPFWETHDMHSAMIWFGAEAKWFERLHDGDRLASAGEFIYDSPKAFQVDFERWASEKMKGASPDEVARFQRYIIERTSDALYPGDTKPAPVASKRVRLSSLQQAQLNHGSYSKRSVADVEKAYDYLIELNGDVPITEIGAGQIRELRDLLLRFPVRGRTPGLRLRDAAKQDWSNTVTPRTVQKIIGFITTGFKLARSEGWCDSNPAEGTRIPKQTKTSIPQPRVDFEPADLEKLFGSPLFHSCLNEHFIDRPGNFQVRDYRHWLPLLGLFTGARLTELCQLETADVLEDRGIWYFRLTSAAEAEELKGEKSLKTEGSRRQVPVHRSLIDLGFIDWVRSQKDRRGLLFQSQYPSPEVLSREASKRFRRYMERIGLKRPGLTFHSFRHTFKTAARMANVPEPINDCLTGHLPQTVAAEYGKNKRRIEVLRDYIDQIQFEGLPKPT